MPIGAAIKPLPQLVLLTGIYSPPERPRFALLIQIGERFLRQAVALHAKQGVTFFPLLVALNQKLTVPALASMAAPDSNVPSRRPNACWVV